MIKSIKVIQKTEIFYKYMRARARIFIMTHVHCLTGHCHAGILGLAGSLSSSKEGKKSRRESDCITVRKRLSRAIAFFLQSSF